MHHVQPFKSIPVIDTFDNLLDDVLKAVSPVQENETDSGTKSSNLYQHESIVLQYKELIREQVCGTQSTRILYSIVFWCVQWFKTVLESVSKLGSKVLESLLQDMQLNSVKAELSELQQQHSIADQHQQDMKQQIQQLKDQNALLKAQKGGEEN